MKSVVAFGVVTIGDLYDYFTGDEHSWISNFKNEKFTAKSDKRHLNITIEPKSTVFNLHIEAVDDEYDSFDTKTENPIRELSQFLGHGVPGGEHFEKMSHISPREFIHILNSIYPKIKVSDPKQIKKLLRRLSTLIPGQVRTSKEREYVDTVEIGRLKKELKDKGWKASETKDSNGIPVLNVDVSGIYVANISVDSVNYKYLFEVIGKEEVSKSGTTDDPISAFEKWIRLNDTKEARKTPAIEPTELAPSGNQAPTVAPKRRAVN